MIEQKTIGGRKASVAYLDSAFDPVAERSDATLVKVLYDDGDMKLLHTPEGGGNHSEMDGFARHRQRRQQLPLADIEGQQEAAAWGRHRQRQSAPFMMPGDAFEPDVPGKDYLDEGSPPPVVKKEIPVDRQIAAWAAAVRILDASEVLIRDLIERDLSGKTGVYADFRPLHVLATTRQLSARIKTIREHAIKAAFRYVRARLGNILILRVSLAKWARFFAQGDYTAIEMMLQSGLSKGFDNAEIARTIVGSTSLNGTDGVTEQTRHKIAHLGRAAIKESDMRKRGIIDATGTFRRVEPPDPNNP